MLIMLSNVKSQANPNLIVMSALFDMTSYAVMHMTDWCVGMFI